MRRSAKISAAPLPLRKAPAAHPVRRGYPAWIDSGEGAAFTALASIPVNVTARVRDSLVLRTVALSKSKRVSHSVDARRGR